MLYQLLLLISMTFYGNEYIFYVNLTIQINKNYNEIS